MCGGGTIVSMISTQLTLCYRRMDGKALKHISIDSILKSFISIYFLYFVFGVRSRMILLKIFITNYIYFFLVYLLAGQIYRAQYANHGLHYDRFHHRLDNMLTNGNYTPYPDYMPPHEVEGIRAWNYLFANEWVELREPAKEILKMFPEKTATTILYFLI